MLSISWFKILSHYAAFFLALTITVLDELSRAIGFLRDPTSAISLAVIFSSFSPLRPLRTCTCTWKPVSAGAADTCYHKGAKLSCSNAISGAPITLGIPVRRLGSRDSAFPRIILQTLSRVLPSLTT